MSDWWDQRDALNTRMKNILDDLENKVFGFWKTCFLGNLMDSALQSKLSTVSQTIASAIDELKLKSVGSTASSQTFVII